MLSNSMETSPPPSPLLQLPLEVWQRALNTLLPYDQQAFTLTCKQARSMVAASAVTQLSMLQCAMTPLPPNLTTFPAAFTAVRHLTLDLTGNLLAHTPSFLQSFQQHCTSILSALISLTLKLNSLPRRGTEQIAQLLASCHGLSLLKLQSLKPVYASYISDIDITLREQSPGAGLHHLSHCFLQCNDGPVIPRLLTIATFRSHIVSCHIGSDDACEEVNRLDNLPTLQDLSITSYTLGTSRAMPAVGPLSSLTRLHLRMPPRHLARLYQQLLQQPPPWLTLLRDLQLETTHIPVREIFEMPPSWSCLQHLTRLSLYGFRLREQSGVWQLARLETMRLRDCELVPPVGFNGLVGLKQLQLLDVSGEAICPSHCVSFPSCLTSLELDAGDSSGRWVTHWLPGMCNLAGSLRGLTLRCRKLPKSSLQMITRFTSLEQLQLACCLTRLANPEPLNSLTQLTSLSLEDRDDGDDEEEEALEEEGDDIPTAQQLTQLNLCGMTRLQELHLDGLMSLAAVRGVPSSLTSLRLSIIDDGNSVTPLPHSLHHCLSLSHVTITRRYMSQPFLSHFTLTSDTPSTLCALTSLQSLHLDEVGPSVPAAMSPMPFLTNLCMSVKNWERSAPPASLQHSTRLRSLTLTRFTAIPPTFPASLTRLGLYLCVDEAIALPQRWGCTGLRSLYFLTEGSGMLGVSAVTELTSLSSLELGLVMDANVNCLDALSMLSSLRVRPRRSHQVPYCTYWLPQLKALKEAGLLPDWRMDGCVEVPPPSR